MKIVRLYGAMDFRVEEVPTPVPVPGEVLVRTEYCGICGSDIPRGLYAEVPFLPSTIGHEFCATVAECGEGVTKVEKGDLVCVVPLIVCHTCVHCKNGNFGQCLNKRFIGLRVPDMGAFAEYNVMPEVNLLKLPKNMDKKMAAFIEPASVALHALHRIEFKPGRDIAIVGAGSIGQLCIQCAKALGARSIYVFDIDEQKLEFAKTLGADHCYNTGKEGFLERYKSDTAGIGIEQVLEVVGLESTIMLAVDVCRVAGKIGLVGMTHKPVSIMPEYMRKIEESELNLIGVWQSYAIDFPGEDWRLAIHYIDNKIIDLEPLLYKVGRMDQANEVFEEFKIPGKVQGKVILTFNEE